MRGGGVCWDMTSTCVQGGLPRPLGGYQPNVIMEPHSPAPAWNMHQSVVPVSITYIKNFNKPKKMMRIYCHARLEFMIFNDF